MKMKCSPQGGVEIWCIQAKGTSIKVRCNGKYPCTRYPTRDIISSLRTLFKITSQKPYFHSERIDNVYPDHVNALHKASVSPPIFPKMGELWKDQYEKTDIDNEKLTDVNKNKNRNVYCCVAYLRYCSIQKSTVS